MSATISDLVTTHFYQWEQRGRGRLWYDTPVQLEPPFYPFFFHPSKPPEVVDDSKRPTLLSSIIDGIRGRDHNPKVRQTQFQQEEIVPFIFDASDSLRVYIISLPNGHRAGTKEMEQLFVILSDCAHPLSFEIIGGHSTITMQLVCRESDAWHVRSQCKAHIPSCRIQESPDAITQVIENGACAAIIDFGLKEEFMRPIATLDSLKLDPYVSLFGILDHLEEHEHIVIQILFQGTVNPWVESIMRSVTDNHGKPFFEDAPEMVPYAKEKVASPLFGVTIKVLVENRTIDTANDLAVHVGKSFGRIYSSVGNALQPLPPDIPFDNRLSDILRRESHRLGMVLNVKELAALAHFPSESVVSSKLVRDTKKTKKAPNITEGHRYILGINEHQGVSKPVTVSTEQRLKHTHIIGATGTGKSTLLLNLITEDIMMGNSLGVLDPHGDLIDQVLERIPEHRIQDVVVIDPADSEYPVGFNILSAHSDIEKEVLSSDLISVFRRFSTSWGDQMNSVFANAILAILESKTGGTLLDLRRFLIEKDFREQFLHSVTDPNVIYYWLREYPLLKSGSIGPILTRLDTFLRPKPIRTMVAQTKSLDIDHLMNTNSIILMKLSQGLIGTENSYLLGTFLVSKIYQAAMARQSVHKEERNPFFLYVDEFQNFITPSLSSILSGTRKYGLGLVLAHQDMHQLTKYDSELTSSLVSNAGTRICFRLGDTDAKRFESGFSFFDRSDLENLQRGEAIARIEKPQYDFNFVTEELSVGDKVVAEQRTLQVISHSRATYGTPRHEVDALFEKLQSEVTPKARQSDQPELQQLKKKPVTPQPAAPIPTDPKPVVEISDPALTESFIKRKTQSDHRYLQMYIKRMAEARGYIAKVEEPTPDGKGRVDVSLEKNGKRIACEICNTTEVEWEIHNIQKCLHAGYDLIVASSNDLATIEAIRNAAITMFDPDSQKKLHFLDPDQLFSFLDQEVAKEASTETRIKGYRVKVEYNTVSQTEMDRKKESIGKTLLHAARGTKSQ